MLSENTSSQKGMPSIAAVQKFKCHARFMERHKGRRARSGPSLLTGSHLPSDLNDRVFSMKIKLREGTLSLVNSSGNDRLKI